MWFTSVKTQSVWSNASSSHTAPAQRSMGATAHMPSQPYKKKKSYHLQRSHRDHPITAHFMDHLLPLPAYLPLHMVFIKRSNREPLWVRPISSGTRIKNVLTTELPAPQTAIKELQEPPVLSAYVHVWSVGGGGFSPSNSSKTSTHLTLTQGEKDDDFTVLKLHILKGTVFYGIIQKN